MESATDRYAEPAQVVRLEDVVASKDEGDDTDAGEVRRAAARFDALTDEYRSAALECIRGVAASGASSARDAVKDALDALAARVMGPVEASPSSESSLRSGGMFAKRRTSSNEREGRPKPDGIRRCEVEEASLTCLIRCLQQEHDDDEDDDSEDGCGGGKERVAIWMDLARRISSNGSVAPCTRLMTALLELRRASRLNERVTREWAEKLIEMEREGRLTGEERCFAHAFVRTALRVSVCELARLCAGAQRRKLASAMMSVDACQRFHKLSRHQFGVCRTSDAVHPRVEDKSMYAVLSDAARRRFERLAAQGQGTGSDDVDGACMEDTWRWLRCVADGVRTLLESELAEEEDLDESTMTKLVGLAGIRPASISAGVFASCLQAHIKRITSAQFTRGNKSHCKAYSLIFDAHKELLDVNRTLALRIEDDFANLDDLDFDDDEDEERSSSSSSNSLKLTRNEESTSRNHQGIDVPDLLTLEECFAPIFARWASDTKTTIENVTRSLLDSPKTTNAVAEVVHLYTFLFDTIDTIAYALPFSTAALAHACSVVASSAQRHAQLTSSEVIALNAQHRDYVTSSTVGLAPARKKSVNVIRNMIINSKSASNGNPSTSGQAAHVSHGGGYVTSHQQSSRQRRHACTCAVKLAEIIWHQERSRALRLSIESRTADESHRQLVAEAFASLKGCLDELREETMNAFVTAVLIIDKGRPCTAATANPGATAGVVMSMIPSNEVEGLKGVERRLFKAIKSIRLPPGDGVVGSIGIGGRRCQQSVDDAVEECAECIKIVSNRLDEIFSALSAGAPTAVSGESGIDFTEATFRSSLKHIGDGTFDAFLRCLLSRVATAIVDATTSDSHCDAAAERSDETEANSGRRSSSVRRRGSSGVINAGKIDVAMSTLNEFEKLLRSLKPEAFEVPLQAVEELRGMLVVAAAAQ